MKTILVTGGAGFIGRHLCSKLLNNGDKIICLDNYYTSHALNIKDMMFDERFIFKGHDILNELHLEGIDEIYHLACPAAPVHYQKSPLYTSKVNSIGTMNILDLALRNKAKILFTSTSEVYGNPEVHPQIESYNGNVNCIGPRACYNEGKRFSESLFFDYWRKYGLEIRVCRLFNTYGPYMQFDDGRVVSNFVLQALKNEQLTVYGDGTQTRSLCYVDDTVDALIMFMNTPKMQGPINIGKVDELEINDIAEKIIRLTGSYSQINYFPFPENDPKIRCPDVTLMSDLGWKAETSLEHGLIKTINYFRRKLEGEII